MSSFSAESPRARAITCRPASTRAMVPVVSGTMLAMVFGSIPRNTSAPSHAHDLDQLIDHPLGLGHHPGHGALTLLAVRLGHAERFAHRLVDRAHETAVV